MQNVDELKDTKSTSNLGNGKPKKEDDLLIVSNNLSSAISQNLKETADFSETAPPRDAGTDTADLFLESTFDFETLKKNYLNLSRQRESIEREQLAIRKDYNTYLSSIQ